MKRRILEKRSTRSLLISIAIHVAIVLGLGTIVWRYPLGQVTGITRHDIRPERLLYITVPPQPTENSGGGAPSTKPSAPAALRAPATPTDLVAPVPADTGRSQAAGGSGTGLGDAGAGAATGVVPRQPDPRIALAPGQVAKIPRSTAESVDSIVALAIGIYNDSALRNAEKPVDWVKEGKNGDIWGMDKSNIYLGKFKIPTALLSLLPLNVNSSIGPIEARSLAYIRRDVLENAQRSISEDEFKAAVKRIRERKEREKRQRELAQTP